MPSDTVDHLADRLAVLGFRHTPGTTAEFTMDGRAVRVVRTSTGPFAEVLVLGERWVDAAVVSAAIDGTVQDGPSVRTPAAACAAALGAARLPAFRRSGRDLDHLHLVEVYWWDAVLVLEVTYNYFDEQRYESTWDSIEADRDARWEPDLTPDQATAFAHALWLATGGELAREPVRAGPITLLPILGDRCELRVLESTEHPKLLGRPWFLDIDLLVTLHTTLCHLPSLFG
ncbi:hypothetical protein [Actinophytocola sp.]|uniref:hypothetical protein n=1 Tax=Actinophytocola sp. TaxID=1872138 RepID=UPI002EDADCED